MKTELSIISDLHSKTLKLQQDINKEINEIYKGTHNKVLERIKEKIIEKADNLEESLRMIETSITMLNNSEEKAKWRRFFKKF